MSRGTVRVVLAVTFLALCATARADDVAKAQAAYHAGSQHYDLGEFKEALESFKEAYRTREDPIFLFNIAQCYRQLGDKQQAIRSYRSFLNKMPDARNRQQVREMIAKLENQVAQEQSSKNGPPQGTLIPNAERPAEAQPFVSPETPPASAPETTQAPVETKLVESQPTPPIASAPAETAESTPAFAPVYKRWWLWTAVGAVAVVGLGVGLGVGLSQAHSTPTAMTGLGTFKF
jgi:tetratricopeptide (TPR) repeat protein